MADNTKDKEMASMLKNKGAARSTCNCPMGCGAILHGRRITPASDNKKQFSHYDFAGAIHAHMTRCGGQKE
jgi:hypothetical protein